MFNIPARLLLTCTALAPVGLTYAWVAFMQGEAKTALLICIASAFLVLICLIMLTQARKKLAASYFHPTSLEAADHENTAFLILYVMPLFTSKFNMLDWQLWIPTLVIFGVITATGYNYHFNPLLSLFRWHFYKVTSAEGVAYVLITKKHLRTAANRLKIGQLTEYIIIDLEGK